MKKTIIKKLEKQGLISNYNYYRKNLPRGLPKKVFVYDQTLFRTLKIPAVFLTYVEKVKLAKMLDDIGVAKITVGFPGISDHEKNDIRKISNEHFEQTKLVALSRIFKSDIDACLSCGIREITIFTPFNGLNLNHRLHMTREEVLDKTVKSIEYAKVRGASVNFFLLDASRTPLPDILHIFEKVLQIGIDRLVLGDSLGFLRPLSTHYLLSNIKKGLSKLNSRDVPLSIQCHNDFGLATANTLAAVEEGVSNVYTSIAGFGERAGIAPLEEVVTALELLYNVNTGINLKRLYKLSKLAEKSFALKLQIHKPIIGENSYTYEVDDLYGVITHELIYAPFPPEIVGRKSFYHLSHQDEKEILKKRLERYQIKATDYQLNEILRSINKIQERRDKGEVQMIFYQIKKLLKEIIEKGLTEDEYWDLVERITNQKPKFQ